MHMLRPMSPQDTRGERPTAEGRPTGTPGISLVPEPAAGEEVQAQLEEFDVDGALVGIVMGSESDMEQMQRPATERGNRAIAQEATVRPPPASPTSSPSTRRAPAREACASS